jgi:RNA ligase
MLDPSDDTNLYVTYAKQHGLWDRLAEIQRDYLLDDCDTPIYIFGEIFGADSTQDLKYGVQGAFRAFDIYIGTRTDGYFLNWPNFKGALDFAGIECVPVLHHGKFSMEEVLKHTDGNTTLTTEKQIREGVVVRGYGEFPHPRYGRKVAKSVSAAYLTRKGEATEYQ